MSMTEIARNIILNTTSNKKWNLDGGKEVQGHENMLSTSGNILPAK